MPEMIKVPTQEEWEAFYRYEERINNLVSERKKNRGLNDR